MTLISPSIYLHTVALGAVYVKTTFTTQTVNSCGNLYVHICKWHAAENSSTSWNDKRPLLANRILIGKVAVLYWIEWIFNLKCSVITVLVFHREEYLGPNSCACIHYMHRGTTVIVLIDVAWAVSLSLRVQARAATQPSLTGITADGLYVTKKDGIC